MATKVKVLDILDYPVKKGTIHHIAVFPPLGIARVGDSEESFLAPEVPAHTTPPQVLWNGKEYIFRDAQQKLRRQAVRFRVYAYDANNTVLGELNTKNGYTLTWKVEVANKKAAGYILPNKYPPTDKTLRNSAVAPNGEDVDIDKRDKLIITASGTISATTPEEGFVRLQGEFHGSKSTATKVDLAQLQVDDAGRLVFIPGKGGAYSVSDPSNRQPAFVNSYHNHDDWFDEICDGKVTVEVKKGDNIVTTEVLEARVLSAPPNFAWGVNTQTTLYDIMDDAYHKAAGSPTPAVDFWTHIWPVLQAPSLMSWTNSDALRGHGPSKKGHYDANELFNRFKGATTDQEKRKERKDFKTKIFKRLRGRLDDNEPGTTTGGTNMPRLAGDAALTRLQYKRFEIWKDDDDFHLTGDGPPVPKSKLEDFQGSDADKQPEQLTRAILESTVGDALSPGIEMAVIAKWSGLYNLTEKRVNPPFRIKDKDIPSGRLTQGLSIPWQSDFETCGSNWWPAVRPTRITLPNAAREKQDWRRAPPSLQGSSGRDGMVKHWAQFGVVREVKSAEKSEFLENEHVVRAIT